MKTLFASLALVASFAAQAGSQVLPEPSLAEITGNRYLGSETPNDITTHNAHQAITGWSADGTQLYAATTGWWPYGYRGSRVASWCGTLTWTITRDPATGTIDPIGVATFTPGNCAGAVDSYKVFPDAFGDVASAVPQPDIFSPPYAQDIATLLTP